MKVQFIGAAQTVTGSKTYIETKKCSALIDCGMYQGIKSIVDKNHSLISFDVTRLDYIILTHGHLDHCGLIPRYYKEGFRGRIICSPATRKIAEIIMLDSARIQVSNYLKHKKDKTIKKSNKKGIEALYDEKDVYSCLELFDEIDYDSEYQVNDISLTLRPAGHILGAAALELKYEDKITYFSGDIGRFNDPMEYDPTVPDSIDNLFMETTYGDRDHDQADPIEQLKKIITETKTNKGKILIPSFAVARTQLLLFYINKLFTKYPETKVPVYVDSPMTKKVTDLYSKFSQELRPSESELEEIFSTATFLKWESDYKKLKKKESTYIIISASGMVSGGRVLKYLDTIGRKSQNTIALVGYQGEGTIGRQLSEGSKEIRLLGSLMPVRSKVVHLHTLSAHADRTELKSWITKIAKKPERIFLLHGELPTMKSFKEYISQDFQTKIHIAKEQEEIIL